ncbi:MAG: peptide chain release factor N(5)-glutamine methyltransferase [Eubacteriales bacterium]|nr:peptide chain release factor N(5)-glutamine methyltransferase [Eubacteriales bacterium]
MNEISRSFRSWYIYGTELLTSRGIRDAETDAWILLEYAANISKSFYFMHMHDPMDKSDANLYYDLLKHRAAHIPVQYLTGEAFFYGNTFHVTPDVLIPRQDTEVLVEQAEDRLMPGMHILDMCTGSGCILLSLVKGHSVTGVGCDISKAALDVAEKNRQRLGIKKSQVSWIQSDLFDAVGGSFDMIVSNPPYIPTAVIDELDPEVKNHEPKTALDGLEDGLFYESGIAETARQYLNPNGWLLVEIGYDQGEAMKKILQNAGYEQVQIIKDLSGNDRVAAGIWR